MSTVFTPSYNAAPLPSADDLTLQLPRKKLRHTRTSTGCKQCRVHRVKCPEGPVTKSGKKVTCRRCWETDKTCFYPVNGRVQRGKLSQEPWELALVVDQWPGDPDLIAPNQSDNVVKAMEEMRARKGSASSGGAEASPDEGPERKRRKSGSKREADNAGASAAGSVPSAAEMLDTAAAAAAALGDDIIELTRDSATSAPAPAGQAQASALAIDFSADSSAANIAAALAGLTSGGGAVTIAPRDLQLGPARPTTAAGGAAPTPSLSAGADLASWLSSSQVQSIINPPAPTSALAQFTLASLSECPVDRSVVSYFEDKGHNEIVAVTKSTHNWIFAELFPRLFTTLFSTPDGDFGAAVREFLHSCLLHLAYVHKGNVEKNEAKSWYWKSEATKYRQKASYASLKARVMFEGPQWKTEEYLPRMGFFVRCIADMLAAGSLQIDTNTAFTLPPTVASTFYPGLHDLLAIYSIFQYACSPLEVMKVSKPVLALDATGHHLVDKFFGFTRRIANMVGDISAMAVQRWVMARTGVEGTNAPPEMLLKAQASRLATDLCDTWDWDETHIDHGLSDRIQRGNEVMRAALTFLLLVEVLSVDLADARLTRARKRALELVADCEPSTMPGFQWALTVIAVYTAGADERAELQNLIRLALHTSFGAHYNGSDEVLALSWGVYDKNGHYEDSIAPWREVMAACGRNLWI
ncbi:uncharacterized protein LOC62_07G009515 [Vanrija pseudolonga]|uniref:Zn(2)-C6 fungal-type domain-containing protein n=1 Tax=Vanrija pseudolonga TaxID=143232 RepID=A0AAF0YKH3_9TREE|nr:hypothetical protein LOC62_07G009515 [Vanrija pseudolonga]